MNKFLKVLLVTAIVAVASGCTGYGVKNSQSGSHVVLPTDIPTRD